MKERTKGALQVGAMVLGSVGLIVLVTKLAKGGTQPPPPPPPPPGSANLYGRVSDHSTGEPIPGAAVSILVGTGDPLETVTGADGTYEFLDLPTGAFSWAAEADGYSHAGASGTLAEGNNLLSVSLEPIIVPHENGTVSGTITDGVSGFGGMSYAFTDSHGTVTSGFSNSSGVYSVSLPPDTYTYLFSGTTAYQRKHGTIRLSAGEEITLNAYLPTVQTPPPDGLSSLSVRVVDDATSMPISGAQVSLRDSCGYNPIFVPTSSDGIVNFAKINDGPCDWQVDAGGYVTRRSWEEGPWQLVAGTNSFEVRLTR